MKLKHITAIVLFPCIAVAQNDSLLVNIPENIIISATRIENPEANSFRNSTVITERQIAEGNYQSLADLLGRQAGITVTGSTLNPGMNQTLFMHGMNSNQFVLMIDGVPIRDVSSVNNQVDLSELLLNNIERIEIIRSANSTLYGSSAIGGMVNIITKGLQKQGWNTSLTAKGGTFGKNTSLFEEAVQLNYSAASGGYVTVHSTLLQSNGFDATVDTVSNSSAFKSFDEDDEWHAAAGGRIGVKNERWDAWLAYQYTTQCKEYDKRGFKFNSPFGLNPLAFYDGDSTELSFNRNLISYKARYRISENLALDYSGGFSWFVRESFDGPSVIDDSGTSDETKLEEQYEGNTSQDDLFLQINTKLFSGITGAGFSLEQMTYRSDYSTITFFGPYSYTVDLDTLNLESWTLSGYIHGEFFPEFRKRKNIPAGIQAGIRFNHNNRFGNVWVYNLNPYFIVNPRLSLFANIASGFNSPSLYQLFSPEFYYTSGITRGNPFLQPEYSTGYEMGTKFRFESGSISANLFYNRVKNVIEYAYLWDGEIPIEELATDFYRDDFRGDTYINAGLLEAFGFDATAHVIFLKRLQATAAISWLEGSIAYAEEEVNHQHTGNHHIQLFNGGQFLSTQNTDKSELVRRPSSGNLKLSYSPVDAVLLSATAQWIAPHLDVYFEPSLLPYGAISNRQFAAYTLFGVSAQYKHHSGFMIQAGLTNVFNEEYVDVAGFTTMGRGAWLKLAFQSNFFSAE